MSKIKQPRTEEVGIRELKARVSEVLHELKKFPKLTLIGLDDDFADFASEVAAHHGLRGSDSIFAAVALRYGTELVTLDKEQLDRLPKVVPVRTP